MAKTKMMTVVLRVTDINAAQSFLEQLGGSFTGGKPLAGVEVVAMSNEDEMTKFEKLYAHCEEEGLYVPRELQP